MALACAALIAVIVRMVATFRENLAILAAARHEAVTDALTGLGNRRRLRGRPRARLGDGGRARARALRPQRLQALQRHVRPPRRRRAAQPPRRAARRAVAGARPRLPHGRRRVLRAARRRRSARPRRSTLRRGTRSPSSGEGFAVDALVRHGRAARARPTDALEALRLADPRMYARKRGRRARARRTRASRCCCALLSERDPELGDHVDGVAELAVARRRAARACRRRARRRSASPPRCTTSASSRSPTRSSTSPGRWTTTSGRSCAATR